MEICDLDKDFFLANLSIMNLEYATAATLVFATPIFLTALSVPLLGNKVGPWRWFAVLFGFLGIVIIVKPGSDIFSVYALLPVGALLDMLYPVY